MPKTKKTTEPEVSVAAAEPKPARKRNTTKAAVASHKHVKSKKNTTVEEQVLEVPVQRSVSREQIAELAYSYWEQRGCQHGSPEQDWLRAEAELTVLAQDR